MSPVFRGHVCWFPAAAIIHAHQVGSSHHRRASCSNTVVGHHLGRWGRSRVSVGLRPSQQLRGPLSCLLQPWGLRLPGPSPFCIFYALVPSLTLLPASWLSLVTATRGSMTLRTRDNVGPPGWSGLMSPLKVLARVTPAGSCCCVRPGTHRSRDNTRHHGRSHSATTV